MSHDYMVDDQAVFDRALAHLEDRPVEQPAELTLGDVAGLVSQLDSASQGYILKLLGYKKPEPASEGTKVRRAYIKECNIDAGGGGSYCEAPRRGQISLNVIVEYSKESAKALTGVLHGGGRFGPTMMDLMFVRSE